MREFKREWEASTPANPLPMGGGAIPFPAPRPLELPRLSPGAAARTAATVTGAVGEAAVPLAAGAASAAPFVYLAWQLGQEIGQSRAATEAAQERARVLPPPLLPPMRMTDEDEPLPTSPTSPAAPADTAERPQQPRVRVAPEGGESLARPTASNPTTTTPTSPPGRVTAPRQAPQPPELPPVDLDRLLPTAITAASLGRLAAQRLEQLRASRGAELEARHRLEADRVFNERLQRAVAQGQVQRLPQADQAWLAADPVGRRLRLAFDPDTGRFRLNEARAAIEAEESGVVPGLVGRAFRATGSTHGADITDGTGRDWDIITVGRDPVRSANQILGKARPPRPGERGEDVLVDAGALTREQREALRQELARRDRPQGTGEIRLMPEN